MSRCLFLLLLIHLVRNLIASKLSRSLQKYIFFTGFGNNLNEEERTIERLVRVLKEEIKFVHAFVIAFKQQDNRLKMKTAETKSIGHDTVFI